MRLLALGLALAINIAMGFLLIYAQDQKALTIGGQQSHASTIVEATFIPAPEISQSKPSIEEKRAYYSALNQHIVTSTDSLEKINQRIQERQNKKRLKAEALEHQRQKEEKALAEKKRQEEALEKKRLADEITKKQKAEQAVTEQRTDINHSSPSKKAIGRAGNRAQAGGDRESAGFGSSHAQASIEASIMGGIEQCYPTISRRRGEEGVAVLSIVINEQNRVSDVRLLQSTGFSRLDQCAIEAVRKATNNQHFISAMRQGKPIAGEIRLRPIHFKLR